MVISRFLYSKQPGEEKILNVEPGTPYCIQVFDETRNQATANLFHTRWEWQLLVHA